MPKTDHMQIEEQIKQFILNSLYFAEDQVLEEDASFLETGVVDSTGVMELVAFIQTTFGLTIEPQEIVVDNFDSIRKVADYIRRKRTPARINGSATAPGLASDPAMRTAS